MIDKIMSKNIITIQSFAGLKEASALMRKHNIGFLPVTENKKIIGVITDRDVAIHPNSEITDMMATNMVTINRCSSLEEALEKMGEQKVKRLLVIDDKKVLGVISLSDIIHHFDNNELIITTFRKIFKYENNKKEENVEIDAFYL